MFWKSTCKLVWLLHICTGVWDRWNYSTKLSLKSLFCYWKWLVLSVEFVESEDKNPNNSSITQHKHLTFLCCIMVPYSHNITLSCQSCHCFSAVQISLAWTQWIWISADVFTVGQSSGEQHIGANTALRCTTPEPLIRISSVGAESMC